MITESENYIITNVQYDYNDFGQISFITVKWVKKLGGEVTNEVYSDATDIAKINLILQNQVEQTTI